MTTHISARVAWHMDGWNGHICKNPAANTYCVGQHSYPGTLIAEKRNLEWEQENAGRHCSQLDGIPPCSYSINAFGSRQMTAAADPPDFFRDSTAARQWEMPASTVSVWPYEEMYVDEVRREGGGFDYDERLKRARQYFSEIEEDRSLVFYYANYSNPFSEEDQRRYAIVGVARVKKVGEELFYPNTSPEVKKKYGGGFVWQRNITSHYPDEGVRLPYHAYLDDSETLEKFLLVPDNPRNFKYGSRHISDDDALDLVEKFLEVAGTLRDMGDTNEDWSARINWLSSLIAELWDSRGLYPGLSKVLDHLDFKQAIPFFKARVAAGHEHETADALFAFLNGEASDVPGLEIPSSDRRKIARRWKLKSGQEKRLLQEVLPRFDLRTDQIERVLLDDRRSYGIHSSLEDIADNPYILSEEFVGDGPDDIITFNKVDHGIFPSPDLGAEPLVEQDAPQRLQGLCVERLKRESKHTFMTAEQVIHDINHKLSFLPEWKRAHFNERYFEADEEELSGALTFRRKDGKAYVYLKTVYEAEREIEKHLRSLVNGPDISFRSPVTEGHWKGFLHQPDSPLASAYPDEYEDAIQGQVQVAQRIFVRPLSVLSGSAGTGKTTVVKALIQATEKAHGAGASFQLLAPTGKAADRLREATGKPASTVHSFIAQRGWLNDNFTYKRSGGKREDGISTYVIDEASMLDLDLVATLFRAINWASVQRLILVGDPNQLPPIGRGRFFADVIDWINDGAPESMGILQTNLRQMENRLNDRGTGILQLASLFERAGQTERKDQEKKARAEEMLARVQEGGDVDKDLRVLYWSTPEDLAEMLKASIISDMEADTRLTFDTEKPYQVWDAAFKGASNNKRPEYMQVMSPYRGEQFGTENLNNILQALINGRWTERIGQLEGITLFDKVIQCRNRSGRDRIWAYNRDTGKTEPIEVFNGELGFVKPHAFDKSKFKWDGFWFKHFQVVFSRKGNYWVGYGQDLGKRPNGWALRKENPEDNLELAYVISVHKAQGSGFERVYFVVPASKTTLLSRELFYTGITRASRHCTILIENDISPLLTMRRPENSHLVGINSSLFSFRPVPDEIQNLKGWYEEGKIHSTLADLMVRSKSEVIITNMLHDRDIPFRYEVPLYASDGTFYLPDFTVTWRGEQWYWEHLGMMEKDEYRNHWETKKAWYDRFFPGRLVTTTESGNLSKDAEALIENHFT